MHSLAMEAAADGISILDAKGEHVYANSAFARMMGFENAEAMLRKSWREIYDHRDVALLQDQIRAALGQFGKWSGQVSLRRQDNSRIPIEMTITAMPQGGTVCVRPRHRRAAGRGTRAHRDRSQVPRADRTGRGRQLHRRGRPPRRVALRQPASRNHFWLHGGRMAPPVGSMDSLRSRRGPSDHQSCGGCLRKRSPLSGGIPHHAQRWPDHLGERHRSGGPRQRGTSADGRHHRRHHRA